MKARIIFHGIAILLLMAALAAAQEPKQANPVPVSHSRDFTSTVSGRENSGEIFQRQWEPASLMPYTVPDTGRTAKTSEMTPHKSGPFAAQNSAHAIESVSGKMNSAPSK